MKYLVLVESPAKIQKIQKILNDSNDGNQYHVAATVGHILSLNSNKTLGVDIDDKYKPDYVPHPEKGDVISNIRRLSKGVDQVMIASDLDQEGEFIGYSICHLLKLPLTSTPRIIFNEITKNAILNAVKNHKMLDFNLLDAQKCRRVSDRLIGFLITRAAKSINPKLTVGRVQTIMVKLIIDREKEMANFQKTLNYHTGGIFYHKDTDSKNILDTKLNTIFNKRELAKQFMEICCNPNTSFKVESIGDRIAKKNPPPPLITSTIQSLVSRSLGISPKDVLDTAQKLYQEGLISYPRTDCPKLPEEKMEECKKHILEKYGEKYHEPRVFKSKDASAQEAHSCIYPTNIKMENLDAGGEFPYSLRMRRVYRFVWLYAVSSQMSPSETKVTKCTIGVYPDKCKDKTNVKDKFIGEHSQLIFEGYQIVWGKTAAATEDDPDPDDNETNAEDDTTKNSIILELKRGDYVNPVEIESKQKATQGPSPYTESTLITQMKRYGVGRPSTYAGILSQVMDPSKKGFIYKGSKSGEKMKIDILTFKPKKSRDTVIENQIEITQNAYRNRLWSTELGRAIDDFVCEYFDDVFNYHFTKDLETNMNSIECGKVKWHEVVDELYKKFAPRLKQFPTWTTKENAESNPARKPKRKIGEKDGKNIYAYLGKYGPVLQVGEDNTVPKPRYISIPKEFDLAKVTFDDVKYLFDFPIEMGILDSTNDNRRVMLKKSKFGLYLDCRDGKIRGKTYQVNRDMFDPDTFDENATMESQINNLKWDLIQKHIKEADSPKECLREVQDIRIIKGKFGPYFIFCGTLVGIPKHFKVDNITYDELLNLYQIKARKGGKKAIKVDNHAKSKSKSTKTSNPKKINFKPKKKIQLTLKK
tara:strand:+ start:4940 stop:7552 length:2613 start_codon:yes stop_codon:yes gene_type:complete